MKISTLSLSLLNCTQSDVSIPTLQTFRSGDNNKDASRLEFDEVDVESPVMTTDTTELMSDSRKQEPTKASRETKKKKKSSTWCWCCSLAFVAQYFDVNTSDVKNRIQNVIMPCPSKKFLNLTHGNPDFYGPFWIATTLIFVIGVTANINEYSSSEDKQWYVFSLCVLSILSLQHFFPLSGITTFPNLHWRSPWCTRTYLCWVFACGLR